MAKYKHIQFVAFDIKPGTKEVERKTSTGAKVKETVYLGKAEASADIAKRCKIMKSAIGTAHKLVQETEKAQKAVARRMKNTINLDVPLKIFMAPEFFFRGADGGYPIEKVFEVQDVMRKETSLDKYKDWLFVLGTAIGYQKRGGPPDKPPPEHAFDVIGIENAGGFVVLEIEDKKAKCSRVNVGWSIKQGGVSAKITAVTPIDRGKFKVTLDVPEKPPPGKTILAPCPATLIEPAPPLELEATEIWNVALVQKGGPRPATDDGQVRETAVFKEAISAIDFLGRNYNDTGAWFEGTGGGRLVNIHGETDRRVVPTEGSNDLLSPVHNKPGTMLNYRDKDFALRQQRITEVNVKGGGGSVFTVDGITFGLEVCLDHANRRLRKYYDNSAEASDPKVQVQLIPSWGMSIARPSICCTTNGLVFNVDGNRGDSDACENTGVLVCEVCDKPGLPPCNRYYCKKCRDKLYNAAGRCPSCPQMLQVYRPAEMIPRINPIRRKGPSKTVDMSGFDKITVTQKNYYTDKGKVVLYESKPIPKQPTPPPVPSSKPPKREKAKVPPRLPSAPKPKVPPPLPSSKPKPIAKHPPLP